MGRLRMDEKLASGFFAALVHFAKELTKTDKEIITDMGLLNVRLYFIYDSPIIGVIVVDPDDQKEEVIAVMKNIVHEFKSKYDLSKWDHNTYPFEKFRDYMKTQIKPYHEKIKEKLFRTSLQIFNKYKNFAIDAEWDQQISRFQFEFDPRLMTVIGTVFDFMGSKILRETNGKSVTYKADNSLIITDTNLNIWNPDLFQVYKDALKVLQEIEADFAIKYAR